MAYSGEFKKDKAKQACAAVKKFNDKDNLKLYSQKQNEK